MSVHEEIEQTQLKILNLERQQNVKDTKSSIHYNFNVINDVLNAKKNSIDTNRYSGAQLARYYDQELVTHLEAMYNILQILDDRLSKLEEKNQEYQTS
jgi:hypothetical protein